MLRANTVVNRTGPVADFLLDIFPSRGKNCTVVASIPDNALVGKLQEASLRPGSSLNGFHNVKSDRRFVNLETS